MYVIKDYSNEKEVINTKHIESLKVKDESESIMMGDYSGTYIRNKFVVRITMLSGQEKALVFLTEKEAFEEFGKILSLMYK